MAQTAAHLVERVMPRVAVRQWVVSVPVPLRYWMASSRDLTTQVHRIVRNAIAQYDVNQAVKRGAERNKIQAGSVTFLQRLGSSLNLNLHFHTIFLRRFLWLRYKRSSVKIPFELLILSSLERGS